MKRNPNKDLPPGFGEASADNAAVKAERARCISIIEDLMAAPPDEDRTPVTGGWRLCCYDALRRIKGGLAIVAFVAGVSMAGLAYADGPSDLTLKPSTYNIGENFVAVHSPDPNNAGADRCYGVFVGQGASVAHELMGQALVNAAADRTSIVVGMTNPATFWTQVNAQFECPMNTATIVTNFTGP